MTEVALVFRHSALHGIVLPALSDGARRAHVSTYLPLETANFETVGEHRVAPLVENYVGVTLYKFVQWHKYEV